MNLNELRERAATQAEVESFPIDQCRRRVNALVTAGAFVGTKISTEKNRWDYGDDALRALVAVLRLEKTGMSSKAAVRRIAEDVIGQPSRGAAELEVENRELRDALRRQGEELNRMQEKLKTRPEYRLPVEWSPWRALWARMRKLFSPEGEK